MKARGRKICVAPAGGGASATLPLLPAPSLALASHELSSVSARGQEAGAGDGLPQTYLHSRAGSLS